MKLGEVLGFHAPADFDGILRNEESLRQQVIIGPFITQEDQNHTSSTSNQQSVASINPQHLLISHSSTPTNHWSNTNNSTEDNSAVHNHNLRSLKIKKRNPLEDSVDDNPRSNGMIEGRLLAVILRPAAENSPSAYCHLEAFIKEISAEIKFNKSDTRVVNLFKNTNTKSNRAFGIAFEEISTAVGQYSHSFKSEVNEEGNTISIGSGTLPQPPNSEELQSFQIHNINEIDINSLMVEDSVSTVQQFGNEKRGIAKFRLL
ncbi:hypothetical protein BY996DRAFT_6571160 [Phakopsora pachyrhizi]|nr:hypothetical protein BY996DRAFT_6571160 [Phakopsora pachyrhizi]